MRVNGYIAVDGTSIAPNEAYIEAKGKIAGAQEQTAQTAEELPLWDIDETAYTPAERGRSQAELAQDIVWVRRAASVLGENGAKALRAAYDEATARQYAPADVVESFYQTYHAAMSGKELSAHAKEKANAMPEHLRIAAQSAGEQDALRAAQAAHFGERAGLKQDANTKKANLLSSAG